MTAEPAGDQAEQAVLAAYDSYLGAFNDHDPDAALAFVVTPLALVAGVGVRLIQTHADVRAWLAEILRGLAEQNYSHTVMHRQEVTLLGDSAALISVEGDRLDSSGRAIGSIEVLYTLSRELDGEWRVAVLAFPPAS